MPRGGKRNPPGGRPPKPPEERKQLITVRLPPAVAQWARQKQNTSSYITQILEAQMYNRYEVIEDNGGGMYLFVFDDTDQAVLGIENIEYCTPGYLTPPLDMADVTGWDSQLDDPQAVYKNITSYEFGWAIVADQNGIYPHQMGRAAQIVYQINND